MEIREVHNPNDGRDPFPVLIGRHKVPINRSQVPSTYPSISMELTNQEVQSYFTPRDFSLAETKYIYGRKFLIHDADNFTKAFYYKNFGLTDFNSVNVDQQKKPLPKMEFAPYNGLGTLEDSLQSCLSLIPQPPKKDFIKMMENDHKVLRFEAILDSVKPEDSGRRFIISYRLADDMITIYEPQVRNSGIIGGKFLERTRISKPGSSPDKPIFYGPDDMFIGSVIQIFSHRFVITNADEYVLKYMEEHPQQFSGATIDTLRNVIGSNAPAAEPVKAAPMRITRSSGDLQQLVNEVKGQVKKIAITGKNRIDELFLRYDSNRSGFIDKVKLRDMCKAISLPLDEDVMEALVREITPNPEGLISLEEFRVFFESA